MKPSDLNPLFSDEDASDEEIARARKLIASVELKEAAKQRHFFTKQIDGRGDESQLHAMIALADCRSCFGIVS
jgi:hypothetical protein